MRRSDPAAMRRASRRETVAGNVSKATNRALPERYLFGRFADLRSDVRTAMDLLVCEDPWEA